MDEARWQQICDIFAVAQGLGVAEREDYLSRACEGDQILGVEVGRLLLAAESQPAFFLEPPDLDRRVLPLPSISIAGFDVFARLGSGGWGTVYKARDVRMNKVVAIKVLHHDKSLSERSRRRFEREIQLLAQLDHPNIVRVHRFEADANNYFYVMDYIPGKHLDVHARDESLGLTAVLALFARICGAVQFLHRHAIIHRDLKPGNILVSSTGTPIIVDFGLAKQLMDTKANLTVTQQQEGTLLFCSPEQVAGHGELVDTPTDVYSLGVILYRLLTGKYPYPADGQPVDAIAAMIRERLPLPPSASAPRESVLGSSKLPKRDRKRLDRIVLTALHKNPNKRYLTAGALESDIAKFLAKEPDLTSSLSLIAHAFRRNRRRIALTLVTLAVAILVGVAGARTWRERRASAILRESGTHLSPTERERFPQIIDNLRYASKIAPNHELRSDIHMRLGAYYESMAALHPYKERGRYLEEAMQAYKQADRALGGTLVNDWESTQPDPIVASPDAVFRVARLRFLTNPVDDSLWKSLLARRDIDRVSPKACEWVNMGATRTIDMPISDAPRGEYARDATVRRVLSQRPKLVPPFDFYGQSVAELVFDPLVLLDENGRYQWNLDVLVCTPEALNTRATRLTIRPGLKWHDGRLLTAEDIVYSCGQSTHQPPWTVLCEKETDHTVVVHHSQPTRSPEFDLTFPVLPKHALNEKKQWAADKPIGNGPYQCISVSDDRIVLERWDGYEGSGPRHMKTVEFRILGSLDERLSALQQSDARRELHEMSLKPAEFLWHVSGDSFPADRWTKVRLQRSAIYDYIKWNTQSALFKDRDVRRALTMAMDLQGTSRRFYGEPYPTAIGPIHADSWAFNQDLVALKYDPAGAAALLEGAGWKLGPDGVRVKGGRGLDFELAIREGSYETAMLALDLISQLGQIGVSATLTPVNSAGSEWLDDFDAVLHSAIDAPHPDMTKRRWTCDGSMNHANFCDPEIEQLFQSARLAGDDEGRKQHYHEIQRRIYEAQPYTFLWHRPAYWLVNRKLMGVRAGDQGLTRFHPGPRAWWFEPEPKTDPGAASD